MSHDGKVIAVALLVPAVVTGCSAHHPRPAPPPVIVRLAIAGTGSDFVIQRRNDDVAASRATPIAQMKLGSSVHLDRRLMVGPSALSAQETPHGPSD